MFNQRQWDELHAFTASFAAGPNSNISNEPPPSQLHQQVQLPPQQGQQFQHPANPGNQHVLHQHHQQPPPPPQFFQQQGPQHPHQQHQQQHQPPTPAPQPQSQFQQPQQQPQQQDQSFQYAFSSQQEWPRFDFNPSSAPADTSQPVHHHGGAGDFGAVPSGEMDWTPSADFSSSFPPGLDGGLQSGSQAVAPGIKVEPDSLNQNYQAQGVREGGGGTTGVGRLIAQFENKGYQPPLPPRPTDNSVTSNSVSSPIPINQHQTSAHSAHFNAAPQGTSFTNNSFNSHSFASNGITTSSDSNFGSYSASHRPIASPIATSPPPTSFGGFHDAPGVTSPGTGPSHDPFGSLDGFVRNNPMESSMATSPMVSSPAPTTPAHATVGTPGFAMWRAPSHQQEQYQQLSQPRSQPQAHPQQHHQQFPQFQQQQSQQPMQQQFHQQQQQDFHQQPQPPQHQQAHHQLPLQSPSLGQNNNVTSPGGYFRPPPPPTPKPTTALGNQFILELNPGSKAKGRAPAKPPKPKAPKPEFLSTTSATAPFSPSIKQEPSTPQPSTDPSTTDSAPQDASTESITSRPTILTRPSREQVPAEAWEGLKSTIRDLYLEQRKPLKEVMSIMAEKYNFQATPKMYKTRFSQWGFVKNNTEDEVKKLLSMKFQRDAEGKVSEFVRNGKIVNLGTYLKRKGVTEYDLVDFELPANLPSHIRCRTPTPPPAPEYLKSPDLMRAQELVVSNIRKAFLQCRQWELETEREVGWPATMVWGAPSSEMLTEANFYFEAGDVDSGGQCLMNAFNQLEIDLKQLSPQAIIEVVLGMVRRDPGLMTALCKYVAAFSTTNYDRSHPLRQIFTCLYDVQQKHGAATLSELLWGSTPLVGEELEAIYGRRHPYVARTWVDLAIFYDQKGTERLEKLALELRVQHRQMENSQGTEFSDLLALRYAIAQLFYAADAESESTKQAADDLLKDMKKAKLLFRVRDSRSNTYCYHCAVKNDPWTKRCRRRYDSVVELLEKHTDVKIQPYFEEDFHTTHHELESQDAWASVMGGNATQSRWGFL